MGVVMENKLCQCLKDAFKDNPVDMTYTKVCRKTKDLLHGDFFVPKGVFQVDLKSEKIPLEKIMREETAEDVLPVSKLSQDEHNSVIFHIDRAKAYKNILQQTLLAGDKYGYQSTTSCDKVVVNPVDLKSSNCGSQLEAPASMTHLRAVILLKHLLQILAANGYRGEVADFQTTENVQDLMDVLCMEKMASSADDMQKTNEELLTRAQTSPWREAGESNCDKDAGVEEGNMVVVNAKNFLKEKGLQTGKGGYDRNLNLVSVRLGDGTLTDIAEESAFIEHTVSKMDADNSQGQHASADSGDVNKHLIHLVSQTLAFAQQQADILWTMCAQPPAPSPLSQHHHVFGTVGRRKSSVAAAMSAKEFYNVRYSQMVQAAMMKYGDHDQGAGWDDMISGLTAASITFDILSTAGPSQVHLDMSEDVEEENVDNRSGPFVLYNCARLATLLESFEQQVEQGVYPPLPDLSDVNFQLLREEEEWAIAFLYIHGFPQLVEDSLGNWLDVKVVSSHIHTHKVSHFLLNFSKVLSSYYSRYHILGGPEEHLLPLMFARLNLLKAAHQVLCSGLRLLGLQPFSQL